MISLLQLCDRAGKVHPHGQVLAALDNGVKIYESVGSASEVLVWIPGGLLPPRFEFENMSREILPSSESNDRLLWPDMLLYDTNTDEFCGYAARKPEMTGNLMPVFQLIEDFHINEEEQKYRAEVGLQIAWLIKAIHETRHGYTLGIITPESFWIDEAGKVFYLESFNCARNPEDGLKSYYIAPELLLYDSWKGKFTARSDAFIYALLLFQIFTGRFPYNSKEKAEHTDVEQIWNLMCDGVSIFYDRTDPLCIRIIDMLEGYSPRILDLFLRVFDYCGDTDYTQKRPTIDEWIEVLGDALSGRTGR